jgi:hypothetical protein
MFVSHMCIVHMEKKTENAPLKPPEWMWKRLEVFLLIFVSNWRSIRHEFGRMKYLEGRVLLILNSSSRCHTLSNAWLTSKNKTVNYCSFSIASLMISLILLHCCTVHWACRNPN